MAVRTRVSRPQGAPSFKFRSAKIIKSRSRRPRNKTDRGKGRERERKPKPKVEGITWANLVVKDGSLRVVAVTPDAYPDTEPGVFLLSAPDPQEEARIEFEARNPRRLRLLTKRLEARLSQAEEAELGRLQEELGTLLDRAAPPEFDALEKLETAIRESQR